MGARCETTFTHDFVRRSLPANCRRILEVGGGDGDLAALLAADGFACVLLDSDAAAVAAARDRGIDARVVQWPEALDEQFEAVLFTRSLHHIHPLAESVMAAVTCLKPGGRVIVEDFAVEAVDRRTLAWFTGAIRSLRESGRLPGHSELLNDLLASDDLPATWHGHHDHDLHPVDAMEVALRAAFRDVTVESAPYFFRYLGAAVAGAPDSAARVRELADQESALIASGAITPLGWRLRGTMP